MQIVSELVESGVPPSNREIREALLSVIEGLPERHDLPDGFRRVVREIDRYLGRRPRSPTAAITSGLSAEVAKPPSYSVAEASC